MARHPLLPGNPRMTIVTAGRGRGAAQTWEMGWRGLRSRGQAGGHRGRLVGPRGRLRVRTGWGFWYLVVSGVLVEGRPGRERGGSEDSTAAPPGPQPASATAALRPERSHYSTQGNGPSSAGEGALGRCGASPSVCLETPVRSRRQRWQWLLFTGSLLGARPCARLSTDSLWGPCKEAQSAPV